MKEVTSYARVCQEAAVNTKKPVTGHNDRVDKLDIPPAGHKVKQGKVLAGKTTPGNKKAKGFGPIA